MKYVTFDAFNRISPLDVDDVVNFLSEHLEQYGDPKTAIRKAVGYASKERPGFGGYIFLLKNDLEIVAAVIINRTGMDEYIPENILVYIATHKSYRGKGLGKKILQHAINHCSGEIALHVEANNPAKFLYEKLGFTNPYLEMRLKR